jgi:hypothetical protein
MRGEGVSAHTHRHRGAGEGSEGASGERGGAGGGGGGVAGRSVRAPLTEALAAAGVVHRQHGYVPALPVPLGFRHLGHNSPHKGASTVRLHAQPHAAAHDAGCVWVCECVRVCVCVCVGGGGRGA